MSLLSQEYWKELAVKQQELKEKISADDWRLTYHLMPETGWMNDPNGVCQFKGVYHFYHQYVPGNALGGEPPHWGHKTSTDLVHFKEEEIFLSPEHDYERNGVYSGSAFVKEDELHFFYTGNVKKIGDYDYTYSGREQNTVHVISKDGFTIDYQEVVIPHAAYPEGFTDHIRDPKVFEKNGRYYMILGGRTRDNEGKILLYRSQDLTNWTYCGNLFGDDHSLGYMWECPDLFECGETAVLIFSPQGLQAKELEYHNVYQAGYIVGEMDWNKEKFSPKSAFIELDRGFDFYAPQTFEDESGRRILWGWMGIGDTKPEYTNPTITKGWQHAATMPRELIVEAGKLKQLPLSEYESLRQEKVNFDLTLDGEFSTSALQGEVYELLIEDIQLEDGFSMLLRQDTRITYHEQVFTLTHGPSGYGRKQRSIALPSLKKLQLFMDTSSIEIFLNDGEYVMTSRVFPDKGKEKVILKGYGKLKVTKWSLKPITE